jgi:hypothetical protein
MIVFPPSVVFPKIPGPDLLNVCGSVISCNCALRGRLRSHVVYTFAPVNGLQFSAVRRSPFQLSIAQVENKLVVVSFRLGFEVR